MRQRAALERFCVTACVLWIGLLLTALPAPAEETIAPWTLDPKPGSLTAASPLLLADAGGAEAAKADNGWEFRLAPYLWLAAMDGDITVRGRTVSVDQDLSDVIDLLEDHFNGGAAAHFEAQKGRFGIFADAMYLSLKADRDTRLGTTIDAEFDQFIGELGLFYTLIDPKPDRGMPTLRLDLLGGARYTWLQGELNTTRLGSRSDSRDWIDPIIGLRVDVGLAKWLSLQARGDIGGFGIDSGATSEFTWNIDAAASFHLAKWFNLNLGYRWLDYDYEDGSGRDRFAYDVTLSGPYLALEFRF